MRARPSLGMVCTVASSAWLLATLLACGHGYQAGNLETGTDSARAASCLEMRVSPHSDERLRELGWVGVEYEMGNSCDGAVPVDLSSAVVVATPAGPLRRPTEDGSLPAPVYLDQHVSDTPIMLSLWDPQDVIQPALLDGRRTAREVVAYVVPPGLSDLSVCVEIASVLNADVEPVCFRWDGAS